MSAPLVLNRRNFLQASLGGVSAAALSTGAAEAQGRSETLLVVQELGPNSLDMQVVGSNQTVNGLSWNCYDRLLSYAAKTLPDGTLSYDREKLAPELAESWEVAADGMSCTFRLRKGATFHDWEDITLDANNNLYAADTGDNNSKRPEVGVYQFPEPDPKSGKKSVHVARQWRLRYPTGPRDCESIVVLGTNCFLISKMTRNRLPEVFTFPLQDSTELITLKPMAHLLIDSPVTAVAIAPDGKRLAAISKMGAFFFNFDETFPSSGIMRPFRQVPYFHQSMEGCTFVPEGLLVTAESREIFLFKIPAH